jgi:hypothetical protein
MPLLQLATVGAGVDVVKVVERQPSLLLVGEASPLSDWSQLDQEELQQQIQVRVVAMGRSGRAKCMRVWWCS